MTTGRLLLHHGICHKRAVALNAEGKAIRVFLSTDVDDELKLGDVLDATITKVSPADGGCFLRTSNKQEGFLSHRSASDLLEGQHLMCRVVAEARTDKLARLAVATEADRKKADLVPLQLWRNTLPGAWPQNFETGVEASMQIDGVFEDALSPIAGLLGGGRLQITPTPALIAIDIDTIGRHDKGRASARARAVNIEAAVVAGRQIALRDLGGNIVIDCIGPAAKIDAGAVKAAFVDSFRAASTRKLSCLPPSPLGLMEAVVQHGRKPLHEKFYATHHQDTPLSELLTGLRRLEIEALACPADQLILCLPMEGFKLYQTYMKIIGSALQDRFGGRILIDESLTSNSEISRR